MTTATPATTAVETPAEDVIEFDLPCAGCGYNLRTSRQDAVCAECGVPVARSLARDNVLWEARPAWLRSLSCGVWMMIAAQILLAIGMASVSAILSARASLDPRVVIGGIIALTVLHAAGAWLLTRRERLFVRPPKSETRVRLVARVGMLGPPAAVSLFAALIDARILREQTVLLLTGGIFGLIVPGVLATYWHLRGLARRVLSRRMSEYATIVAVGGAASVLLLVAWFIASMSDVYVDVNNDAVFVTMLLMFTALILFYLWSLVVLVMFAVSFARASRSAEALWNERAVA